MKKIVTIAVLACLVCTVAVAEMWPPLETYANSCVLIVKCKTEVEGEKVKYKVDETWKGKYSPDLFYHKPPEGYLYTGTGHGNGAPTSGREVIFFFTKRNQPSWTKGKLLEHSTSFVVKDGKLIYAPTSWHLSQEYTVAEFKRAISAAVEKQKEQDAEPTDPPDSE